MIELDPRDPMRHLLEAGFTAAELRAIANDLLFGSVVAEGTGEDVDLPATRGVAWTPEKRAAFNRSIGEVIAQMRYLDEEETS